MEFPFEKGGLLFAFWCFMQKNNEKSIMSDVKCDLNICEEKNEKNVLFCLKIRRNPFLLMWMVEENVEF
jgi:hypothetical protein